VGQAARHRGPRLVGIAVALWLLVGAVGSAQQPARNKLGTLDVQKILTDSDRGKAVLAELEKFQKDKTEELLAQKAKVDELKSRYSQSRLSLAEDKLEEMAKEIEDGTIALTRAQDDAEREFQKQQQVKFTDIERAVLPIISEVGQELGYTMIFNKFQSGLVYADEAIDITDLVIERFNASGSSSAPSSPKSGDGSSR
jgi:outer membrane protein